ncbi:Dyp-type peroxidase [Flammeovirga kamogawensis]|uniref:Dyp-type peroxidase n=1 Tax=Flammeovirga kamogawensis TaxID=373891 RepID=A0ABX8GYG5_9BACT|nr:Dyp-type peroxidase [Flammeovirga kamogawensis]MBB6462840.1 putative iron-dependent peroxidase [Flammeovirga kamogawensis]QWG08378.1 Dyp-type peroxidase [Flammeovirga kamogawensis]TRX66673.1 Dyp-type peroxidase [Flammeovirga kamogawensis]
MQNYQLGIFNEEANIFNVTEYKVNENISSSRIKKALNNALHGKSEEIEVVVSFGKDILEVLAPQIQPKGFKNYVQLNGVNDFVMPSNQADLYFRVIGIDNSQVLDKTIQIQEALKDITTIVISENGFVYKDHRDLTGFVDGSANPKEEKKYLAAIVPEGEPAAGGSFVFHQKWVHDLVKFNELPVSIQEKVIGRTKPDSIELEGDAMPADSHVSRTDASHEGVAMKIWRRSFPFGSATEKGLFFIAYTCDPFRIDIQLERMLGNTKDGVYDQMMNYSKATTGAYSFAPSLEDLKTILAD